MSNRESLRTFVQSIAGFEQADVTAASFEEEDGVITLTVEVDGSRYTEKIRSDPSSKDNTAFWVVRALRGMSKQHKYTGPEYNVVRFVDEVLGVNLEMWQRRVLRSLEERKGGDADADL